MFRARLLLLLLLIASLLQAQPIIDNFEQNNLDNWTLISGNAEISGDIAYADMYSVRLFEQDDGDVATSMIRHKTFDQSWGRYKVKCYADGPVSDVIFRFQYINENNYYEIICNPTMTDNPMLALNKVVDGIYENLVEIPPIVGLDRWFQITLSRTCAGEIIVLIDDVEQIRVIDNDIRETGSIGLGAWAESSYFDDLTYEDMGGNIIVNLEETICSGTFYTLGDERYGETGFYSDTIISPTGCDSIVNLDLEVKVHYLSTIYDTICAGETVNFDGQILDRTGRYVRELESQFGCDSIVEFVLLVLGADTIRMDTTICEGDFMVFGDDTINTPGYYYDTLSSNGECVGVIELLLEVVDAIFSLGPDQSACFDQGQALTLSLDGQENLLWSDGTMGSSFTVSEPGTYWAEVSFGSCTIRDSIAFINVCDEIPRVYIPNGFSPNGDNQNDIFFPRFASGGLPYSLRVFDRFGGLIFSADDLSPGQGWDGMVNGKEAPMAVYLYLIEIEGEKYTGDITIVR